MNYRLARRGTRGHVRCSRLQLFWAGFRVASESPPQQVHAGRRFTEGRLSAHETFRETREFGYRLSGTGWLCKNTGVAVPWRSPNRSPGANTQAWTAEARPPCVQRAGRLLLPRPRSRWQRTISRGPCWSPSSPGPSDSPSSFSSGLRGVICYCHPPTPTGLLVSQAPKLWGQGQ